MISLLIYIRNIAKKSADTLASLLKIIFLNKPLKEFPTTNNKELVILGNGPSLKKFLNEHPDFIKDKELLAVNHFVNTKEYELLKPSFYVINAPEFWINNVDRDVIERRKKVFRDFADKTNWKLNLFLGVKAKKSDYWKKIIQNNKNIIIYYFNNTPLEGFRLFKHYCMKKNCGMPRPHNVLIPSLVFGINIGFKNIYIAGADHNWMQELFVADDNTVYLTQKHFYDEQSARPEIMKKTGKGKRLMHEILHKFVLAFKGYHEINKYAKTRGVKIINITPYSMIDAFEKQRIK